MEALVQAQRKELASQLAAGVAHDFNNVLFVISMWSRKLVDGSLPPEDQEAALQVLADAQAQGRALGSQLTALARPESRSVKRFPLDRPIRTAAQTLTAALPRGIQLECEAPAALEVEADETEVQQVIYNLVLNARDAMPDGGDIRVTGGIETSSIPITVVDGALAAGHWATLSVTDSGPGVDPMIRDRIFDLFFTTKGREGGTGLGLATVLRIAKANGGGVALESRVGRGATFKLYLPACGPSAVNPVRENNSLGGSMSPEVPIPSTPGGEWAAFGQVPEKERTR
jgi:signal transduction histidine kinase